MKKLSDCALGKFYEIKEIKIKNEQIVFQLKNLIIEVGSKIKLLKTNYGKKSFLIECAGICYAIDCLLAKEIFVDEVEG